MVNEINLSKCVISENNYPFIIAEIGNNHNGDMQIAKKLIDEAEKCGVSAVKFQTKDIETAFPQELLNKNYEGPNSFGKTYREHKEALELNVEQLKELKIYSDKKNLIFFSTPFDIKSLENLEKLNVEIYKISSFHVTDLNLVEAIATKKKPVIMSTGMSTLEEIDSAVEILKRYNCRYLIMHCVSSYPADPKDLNLRAINILKKRYNCLVGYSGHETSANIAPSVVLFGACAIERHFTLDRAMKGPDHALSLSPPGMDILVKRSKILFDAKGREEKFVTDSELKARKKFRGY
jgi:sialic acid synthase SpsE